MIDARTAWGKAFELRRQILPRDRREQGAESVRVGIKPENATTGLVDACLQGGFHEMRNGNDGIRGKAK